MPFADILEVDSRAAHGELNSNLNPSRLLGLVIFGCNLASHRAPPDAQRQPPFCLMAVSTPRNSMPDKARGLRLMLLTELGGR
ncbi:hypothetical protein VDP83_09085, partial [Xanthomonas campestris pv. campestris]|nr:hypothetical protein [Xanthomonas campestris pv. campestris]